MFEMEGALEGISDGCVDGTMLIEGLTDGGSLIAVGLPVVG